MKYIPIKLSIVIIACVHGLLCLADSVEDSSQAEEEWLKKFVPPPGATPKPWSMEIEEVRGAVSGADAQDLVEGLYFKTHGHRQFQHAFSPVAYRLGNEISGFASKGDVVWQVRVHDKLTSELFALAWVHTDTKSVFFLYDSETRNDEQLPRESTVNPLINETIESETERLDSKQSSEASVSLLDEIVEEATAPAAKEPAGVVAVENVEETPEESTN